MISPFCSLVSTSLLSVFYLHKKFDLHLLCCSLVEAGQLGPFLLVELAAGKVFGFIVAEEQGLGDFPFLLDFLQQSPQSANLFAFLRILLEKLIILLLKNLQFLLQAHKFILQLDYFTHHGRVTRLQQILLIDIFMTFFD